MRNRRLLILGLLLVLVCLYGAATSLGDGAALAESPRPTEGLVEPKGSEHPAMRPDLETLLEWQRIEEAHTRPGLCAGAEPSAGQLRGHEDLLEHLDYVASERDQGYCGNCWVWPGTGIVEIALDVQEGIKDRLSIQYLNSNYSGGSGRDWACCGGNLDSFADWYHDNSDIFVPWSNANASWQDGSQRCGDQTTVSASSIGLSPNYPFLELEYVVIETHGVGQAQAIANIKSYLDNNQAVYFAMWYPDWLSTPRFGEWWHNETEQDVYDPGFPCGRPYIDGEGSGHAMLCVGYDDTDPNNPYWIILNSWGTEWGQRPNGLLHLDMNMDYACSYPDPASSRDVWASSWATLDVGFDLPTSATRTPTPTLTPSESGICEPAEFIDCGFSVSGNNSALGSSDRIDSYSCVIWRESGPEYAYGFQPLVSGEVTVSLSGLSGDLDLFVLEGDCDAARCITYGNDEVVFQAVAGETYYLVVDGWHGAVSDYTISVSCVAKATPTPTRTPTSTCTCTPTHTHTPTPTATPTKLPRFIWQQEAEAGTLISPMIIGLDPDASSGRYVTCPIAQSGGAVEFMFQVPLSGDYYLWSRAMGLDLWHDSFYVYLDYDYGTQWHDPIPQFDGQWTWGWQEVDVNPLRLSAGYHVVRFEVRESYARLDCVFLTNDRDYVPFDMAPYARGHLAWFPLLVR